MSFSSAIAVLISQECFDNIPDSESLGRAICAKKRGNIKKSAI